MLISLVLPLLPGDNATIQQWSSDGTSIVAPRTVNGVQGIYAIATDGSGALTLILPAPAGTWVDSIGTVVGNPIVMRQLYLPLIMK